MPIVIGGTPALRSYAPIPTTPTNGAYVPSLTTFDWTYMPAVPGNVQTGYAFRYRAQSATTYSWWNASTTNTVNYPFICASGVSSTTINALPAGTYYWSVATLDVNGLGAYCADQLVVVQPAATLTVSVPSETTPLPVISWSASPGSNAALLSYRVTVTQYGQTVPLWDSGTVPSAVTSSVAVPAPFYLVDGTQYTAQVTVTQTGNQSVSASVSWTTIFGSTYGVGATAAPGNAATTGSPVNVVTTTLLGNLLNAPEDSFETGIGTVGAFSGATLTTSTTEAVVGTHSLTGTIGAAASGDLLIWRGPSSVGYPVTAGATIHAGASAFFTAGAPSTSSAQIYIQWFDAAGTGTGSSTPSTAITGAGAWLACTTSAVVPAGVVSAQLVLLLGATASSTVYYVDACWLGAFATYSASLALSGDLTVSVQFSDDQGQTWWPLRNTSALPITAATPVVTVNDEEIPPGYTRWYEPTIVASTADGSAIAAVRAIYDTSAPPKSLRWWLKDPLNPSANMQLSLTPGTLNAVSTDRQSVNAILMRPDPVVLSDTFGLPKLTFDLVFTTDAAYQAFEALRATQHILLLQGPFPAGQWYIRLGQSKTDATDLASLRLGNPAAVVRTIQINAQAVAMP